MHSDRSVHLSEELYPYFLQVVTVTTLGPIGHTTSYGGRTEHTATATYSEHPAKMAHGKDLRFPWNEDSTERFPGSFSVHRGSSKSNTNTTWHEYFAALVIFLLTFRLALALSMISIQCAPECHINDLTCVNQ